MKFTPVLMLILHSNQEEPFCTYIKILLYICFRKFQSNKFHANILDAIKQLIKLSFAVQLTDFIIQSKRSNDL